MGPFEMAGWFALAGMLAALLSHRWRRARPPRAEKLHADASPSEEPDVRSKALYHVFFVAVHFGGPISTFFLYQFFKQRFEITSISLAAGCVLLILFALTAGLQSWSHPRLVAMVNRYAEELNHVALSKWLPAFLYGGLGFLVLGLVTL